MHHFVQGYLGATENVLNEHYHGKDKKINR